MRKVLGAERLQLTGQFIFEAQASAWLGLLLAGLLTVLALPLVNSLLDKTYTAAQLLRPGTLLAALAVTVLTGLAAGIYPAVIFSRFSSERMLKGSGAGLAQKAGARRLLLLFQFAISIALIIATLSIVRQIAYMKDRPLGFAKTQQLVLPVRAWSGIEARAGLLQNEFERLAAVSGSTFSSSLPGREMSTFGTRLLEEDWNRSRVFQLPVLRFRLRQPVPHRHGRRPCLPPRHGLGRGTDLPGQPRRGQGPGPAVAGGGVGPHPGRRQRRQPYADHRRQR